MDAEYDYGDKSAASWSFRFSVAGSPLLENTGTITADYHEVFGATVYDISAHTEDQDIDVEIVAQAQGLGILPQVWVSGQVHWLGQLQIRAGTGKPEDENTESIRIDPGQTESAKIPLGAQFFVQYALNQKQLGGGVVPVEGDFTLREHDVEPDIDESALFPNNVVIEFDKDNTLSGIQHFQAIHLGKVELDIEPVNADRGWPTARLEIEVVPPRALGEDNNDFDEKLVDFAHLRGIPPHLLKGQAAHENGKEQGQPFNRQAYRYEPISHDVDHISKGGFPDPSRFADKTFLKKKKPYCYFRLATTNEEEAAPYLDECTSQAIGGLPEGTLLEWPADVEKRERYYIERDDVRRTINAVDQFVTAREIIEENDGKEMKQNWLANTRVAGQKSFELHPEIWDFTAQTTLAASYGVFQMTYLTAVDALDWQGDSAGRKNPSRLLDTEENHGREAGSIGVASAYLVDRFRKKNQDVDQLDPSFPEPKHLKEAWERMFKGYNSRKPTYVADVMGRVSHFDIKPKDSIFEGGRQ